MQSIKFGLRIDLQVPHILDVCDADAAGMAAIG
jgi:hypothetical protein